ncbi:MAG: hypothetical protein M3T96_01135, partial [Acidobacteriota bacterium]|nr:hypothetical protein [Acidobacteriota bacterium]
VNRTMDAPAVENVNANQPNAPVQNSNMKPANAAVDMRRPLPSDENALSDTAVAGKIGVPECDEYLDKYEACIKTKVPEAERGALIAPFEKQRQGWQIAATNQTAKAALPGGCKVAMATAKQSLAKYSCHW